MAAFNYDRSRASADRLIAKFGQAGFIRRSTPGTTGGGDPWYPVSMTGGASADYACTVVVLDYSAGERDGTLIRVEDRKVLIAVGSLEIEPAPQDQIVLGGVAHPIIDVKPLNPGGTNIYFEAQVRT